MKAAIALAACFTFMSTSASAGPASPANGRWILDVSKSTFAQPAPKSVEVTLTDQGETLSWHSKSVNAEGKANEASGKDVYGQKSLFADGKGERLITKLDASTVKRSFKYPDGGTLDDTCTVAADTMTCTGTRVRDGQQTATKAVYTRAK